MTTYLFGYSGERLTLAEMERTDTWGKVHPEVRRRVVALMEDCPHDLGFGNGWRSSERQAENYERDPNTYAPPGSSYHESTVEGYALAVDLLNYQPAIGWADDNADRYGLVHFKFVNGEPWHFQPVEIPHARRYFDPAEHQLGPFLLPGRGAQIPQEDIMLRAAKLKTNGSWWLGDGTTRWWQAGGHEADLRIAGGAIDAKTAEVVDDWGEVSYVTEAFLDRYVGSRVVV